MLLSTLFSILRRLLLSVFSPGLGILSYTLISDSSLQLFFPLLELLSPPLSSPDLIFRLHRVAVRMSFVLFATEKASAVPPPFTIALLTRVHTRSSHALSPSSFLGLYYFMRVIATPFRVVISIFALT